MTSDVLGSASAWTDVLIAFAYSSVAFIRMLAWVDGVTK